MISGNLEGAAKDSLMNLVETKRQFDLIFIDTDKPSYIDYYKHGLLAPSGTIVVDNALMFEYPYTHDNDVFGPNAPCGPAIEKFNNMVLNDDKVHRVLLPVRDGVMLVRSKAEV